MNHTIRRISRKSGLIDTVAGGGVKGGRVVGASDTIGGFPAERPVSPGDIVATIFQSLGLDHTGHLQGPAGRPFALTDFGTEPIKELFA